MIKIPTKEVKPVKIKKNIKENEGSKTAGLVSTTTASKVQPVMGSTKVKIEGKEVTRQTTIPAKKKEK